MKEAKNTNEQRMNELVDELNQYKENIVPELENQCDTLKSELQNRGLILYLVYYIVFSFVFHR